MSNTPRPARKAWNQVFRAFRVAHSQVPIMSENGIAVRLQATSTVRDFTGKWDLPREHALEASPWARRKTAYKPTLAFRRFMKAN